MKTANHIKQTMRNLGAVLIIIIGFALMVFMLVVEDEPGRIPLLLIALGTIWYYSNKAKVKPHRRQFE